MKQGVQEAFLNLSKLASRIPSDESKRLVMMLQVISAYIAHLEEKINKDEDDDSRC